MTERRHAQDWFKVWDSNYFTTIIKLLYGLIVFHSVIPLSIDVQV